MASQNVQIGHIHHHRGHPEDEVYLLFLQKLRQPLREDSEILGNADKHRLFPKGQVKLQGEDIEVNRRKTANALPMADIQHFAPLVEEINDAPVVHDYPFGGACGTGSVDDAERVSVHDTCQSLPDNLKVIDLTLNILKADDRHIPCLL